MKLFVRGLFAFSLALALSLTLSAEEKKKEDKKPQEGKKPAVNLPAPLNAVKPPLTEEQLKKVADLQKEYTQQLTEINKKSSAIITTERAKARQAAAKQAAADGKKGKEAEAIANAALKLTDEEAKNLKEIDASRAKLNAETNKKRMEILTDEQKASLKKPAPAKDKKPEPAKEKKPEAKKPETKTEVKPEAKKPEAKKPEAKTEPKKDAK